MPAQGPTNSICQHIYLVQETEEVTANKADTPDAQQFPVPHRKSASRCWLQTASPTERLPAGLLLAGTCWDGAFF